MKLAVLVYLVVGSLTFARDLPVEELRALLDYDRMAPSQPIERLQGSVGDPVIVDYSFVGPAGARVPGLLVPPRPGQATPLILYGHWMMPGSPLRGKGEFLEEAKLLARAGATCLLLDSPLVRPGVMDDPDPMNGQGPLAQVQMAKEWRRAIDPDRIAYVGHSFNAGVGAMLAGVEKRIGSFVLMANQYSLREYMYDDQNPIAVAQRKEVGDEALEAYLAKFPWADTGHFVKHSSPVAVFLQFGTPRRAHPTPRRPPRLFPLRRAKANGVLRLRPRP